MAAAKCRNRRRELTDTLQAVSKANLPDNLLLMEEYYMVLNSGAQICLCSSKMLIVMILISFKGDGQAGGGQSHTTGRNQQSAEGEEEA